MKEFLAISVIMSFLAVGVFGVFAMGHAIGPDHAAACLAALSEQTDCPEGNPIASATFHSNIFLSFSQAVFTMNSFGVLLLALLTLAVFGMAAFLRGHFDILATSFRTYTAQVRSRTPLPVTLQERAWLSQLEHSPSFA